MIEVCFYTKKIFPVLHESSTDGDGRFHEQKTEIKGIIGVRKFMTTDAVSCNNESKKGGKYQELIQSSITPDQGYHMRK